MSDEAGEDRCGFGLHPRGIDGADAYRMLLGGELDGGPGREGMAYFDGALSTPIRSATASVSSPLFYRIFYRIVGDWPRRRSTE